MLVAVAVMALVYAGLLYGIHWLLQDLRERVISIQQSLGQPAAVVRVVILVSYPGAKPQELKQMNLPIDKSVSLTFKCYDSKGNETQPKGKAVFTVDSAEAALLDNADGSKELVPSSDPGAPAKPGDAVHVICQVDGIASEPLEADFVAGDVAKVVVVAGDPHAQPA